MSQTPSPATKAAGGSQSHGTTAATADEIPPYVDRVLKSFDGTMTLSDLADLPSGQFTTFMESIHIPVKEQLMVCAYVKRVARSVDPVREHFQRDYEARVHPWRPGYDAVCSELDVLGHCTKESLQDEFATKAKNHEVTTDSAALLQALLFFDEAERLKLAAAVIRWSGTQLLQLFNGLAARRQSKDVLDTKMFIEQRGSLLLHLTTPLWPRDSRFTQLQQMQFSQLTQVAGGGSERTYQFPCGPILSFTNVGYATGPAPAAVSGGGHLHVERLRNGSWVADASPVEAKVAKVQRHVDAIDKRIMAPPAQSGEYVGPRDYHRDHGRNKGQRGRGPPRGGDTALESPSTTADPTTAQSKDGSRGFQIVQ